MVDSAGAAEPHGITVEETGGVMLVRLVGEVDASRRAAASECMVTVVQGTLPLVIDTSAVTFIDSSGLAFLLQLKAVATDAGRPVLLRDPSGAVVDLLALVGLDTMFSTGEAQGV
jgi:anti-anti-sigma factor